VLQEVLARWLIWSNRKEWLGGVDWLYPSAAFYLGWMIVFACLSVFASASSEIIATVCLAWPNGVFDNHDVAVFLDIIDSLIDDPYQRLLRSKIAYHVGSALLLSSLFELSLSSAVTSAARCRWSSRQSQISISLYSHPYPEFLTYRHPQRQ